MKNICICFQVHHPYHFQLFRPQDIGSDKSYFDYPRIENEINDAVTNYYLPTNDFLLSLINNYGDDLKFTFYISGTSIDQFLLYEPQILTSFRDLADTSHVDFLGSTSSHSLVTLTNHKKELVHQIKDHQFQTNYFFGFKPQVFVNSDLLYSDLIGKDVAEAGYKAIITNGTKKTLAWRSPNYVYSNTIKSKMDVYFRNEQISNELTHQLASFDSNEREPNPRTLFALINQHKEEPLLNLYIDYKSLGGRAMERKQQFLERVIGEIYKQPEMTIISTSEIAHRLGSVASITANEPICWVNHFHPNYYPGNELQMEGIRQLYLLQNSMARMEDTYLQKDWQYLQTSDHIHLMDEQHPIYQHIEISSIYKTKYDAFINFMNIVDDFRLKIQKETGRKEKKQLRSKEHSRNRK